MIFKFNKKTLCIWNCRGDVVHRLQSYPHENNNCQKAFQISLNVGANKYISDPHPPMFGQGPFHIFQGESWSRARKAFSSNRTLVRILEIRYKISITLILFHRPTLKASSTPTLHRHSCHIHHYQYQHYHFPR